MRSRLRGSIYTVLDQPWIYRSAQLIFAPGQDVILKRHLRRLRAQLPPAERLLDLGCGPASWLFRLGLKPVGVDLSPSYIHEYTRTGAPAVVASALQVPFRSDSFDGVWSVGLYHHVPDAAFVQSVQEAARVCRVGGYVVVIDAVQPRSVVRRPLAALIRRLDRGEFIRSERRFLELIPFRERWHIRRLTFTLTGLEVLACWMTKSASGNGGGT